MVAGSNLGRTLKATVVALVIIAAPIASYFLALSLAYGDSASELAMMLVAMFELVIVQAVVRRRRG